MDTARRELEKIKAPTSTGEYIQEAFALELARYVATAGPAGWLEWATDYRNMLVHRGRRLQVSTLEPRGALLYDANNRPVLLAREVQQLAQDPALSDVETFLSTRHPVLSEDAGTTLSGVMTSALKLAQNVGAALLGIWSQRRNNPGLLVQPRQQWKSGASSTTRGFAGYRPGTKTFSPNIMVGDDTMLRRLKAAALDDRARGRWSAFD